MNNEIDMLFLRKVVEKACGCPLDIEIGRQKFSLSGGREYLEIVHVQSQDNIETNDVNEMLYFMSCHSPYLLAMTNSDLCFQVIDEVIEIILSPEIGVTKNDLGFLVSSMFVIAPDEVEKYQLLMKRVR